MKVIGFSAPLTHTADEIITIAAVSYTSKDKVCIAAVNDKGEWFRLVNPFQRAGGNRFWRLNDIREPNVMNHIIPGDVFQIWGKQAEEEIRGIKRQREDYIPLECSRFGFVRDLHSQLLPACISMGDFSKYMNSQKDSLFAIKINRLQWVRKYEDGIVRYFGYLDDVNLRNVYYRHPEDGSYQITDLTFFEQTEHRGYESSGYCPNSIVVFGLSRIGKPLIVSIIKER